MAKFWQLFTFNNRILHHHQHRYFCIGQRTKGIDWAKRRKILRIAKYKQKQSPNVKKSTKQNDSDNEENNNAGENPDIFLDQIASPGFHQKVKYEQKGFVKRKFDKVMATEDSEEEQKSVEYEFRPALLTKMVKNTRSPQTALTLWLRDRSKCPIDHINTSAAIVHLAQLSLEQIPSHLIYSKTMSWSVIRLVRDCMLFINDYQMRQIANIMWSIGVLSSNNSDETIKIHKDFRRLCAKLVNRFESEIEIRRKCDVQHLVDMLWAMSCVGLKTHPFFYQFCVDLYIKMDIDLGVTPDALSYLATLYASRVKLNDKLKHKVYNERISKHFWLKLLKEFSDNYVLIEAEPHHIANMLWAIGRIGNLYLTETQIDVAEHGKMNECIQKLLDFVQHRLNECDGKTLSILLWCVSCSNFESLSIFRKHSIFDYDKETSVGQRICQLIESEDACIIPTVDKVNKVSHGFVNKYSQNKVFSVSLIDCIVIFECVSKMEFAVPSYVLTLMLNRMKQQIKYNALSVRELIALLESVDMLRLTDDMFLQIMAKKLIKGIEERPKMQWNYSEFVGLLKVMNKYEILSGNLDLVHAVLSSLQLTKQGWGQQDGVPIGLLNEQFAVLEKYLLDNNLIIEVAEDEQNRDVEEGEYENDKLSNFSVLVTNTKKRIAAKLRT